MDFTDIIFDFLSQISNSIQEEFDEILRKDSKKKRFVRALSKILALLCNIFFITIFHYHLTLPKKLNE